MVTIDTRESSTREDGTTLARSSDLRYDPYGKGTHVKRDGKELHLGRWTYQRAEGNVMAQQAVPATLVSFTHFWSGQLGLDDKNACWSRMTRACPIRSQGR